MFFSKSPEESPEKLLNILNESYSKVRIFYSLKTAVDLNLFDFLEDFKSVQELANILKTELTLTKYLLKILCELNLLENKKKGNSDYYKNKKVADIYLKKNSEYNISNLINFYSNNFKSWESLESILKSEHDTDLDVQTFFPDIITRMADECKCWELQKVLREVSKYQEFKSAKKLLDLAGGHGLYAIGFSMLNIHLKSYVFDLISVIEETKKFIKKYKAKNVFTIAGDFYKDNIGENYDVIFTSYNPGGKNPQIAKKAYNALQKGGLFIDKQFFFEKENSLDDFLDNMEWHFSHPKGLKKGKLRYTFEGDLNLGHYLQYLKDLGFEILNTSNIQNLLGFGSPSVKMIVARKL